MAVSEIGARAAFHVTSPQVASAKPATQNAKPVTTSTPAATVQISPQALAAAAKGSATTAAPTATAPKVNNVKLANKEANEPLVLLTKQAKHGDVVAKLILKQLAKKQAAHQSENTTSNAASNVADDEGETEGASGGHESSAKITSSAHAGEEESGGPVEVSESGENQHADQHS